MSSSEDSPTEIFSVKSVSEFEDDNEALEALVQLKELDFGEVFTSRNTQLDTDEGDGISIQFYHDDNSDSLTLSSRNDSNISIRLSLATDSINQAGDVLAKIIESIDDFVVESITLYKTFDVAFNNLDLPINEDSSHQVVGIRLKENGRDYIIQEDENDVTSVHMVLEEPEGETESIITNIGTSAIETTTEFVDQLK